jgi:RND family efflux transporter MFP subunit
MPPHDSNSPDDVAPAEQDSVSTQFDPNTGRRLKAGAGVAAAVLLLGFTIVGAIRFLEGRALARAEEKAYLTPPPVDVVIARPVSAGQDLVLPGQTAAWYDATIYARVNGYVAKWSVDIGDHVKKGQVLATIETPELDAELRAALAQLRSSQAQVVARKAEAEFCRTTNERWRDSPKGVVSDQEREAKKADYESAEARLYAATAQVELDKARVEQYRASAEFKQVTAPFDGTITERKIDVGNLVTAGSTSATTPLYKISQNDTLRVFVDVPQSVAAELMTRGAPAEVRPVDGAAAVVAGTVTRSAEAINMQARTMRVEVDIPNAARSLVPGMYVNVAFRLQSRGLIEVPAAALVFRANGAQVARVGADNKVSFQSVRIARDNGSMVELESGAGAGDRLVLNISSQIAAGETVTVTESAGAKAAVAKR